MKNFLSCDWGTSSFRLRYVDITSFTFSTVESKDHGIAKCYELWQQSREERLSFYLDIIRDHITILERQLKFSVKDIPIVISGMATSAIGMMELPYATIPCRADGSGFGTKRIKATHGFPHDILLISGLKSVDDVMRGEETQLAGCEYQVDEEKIFIIPGTHSKRIHVNGRLITDFITYMTGEFFDFLSRKSILSGSVEEQSTFEENIDSFIQGVTASDKSTILHTAFQVRTNHLFGKLSKEQNYYYLSGLLIGTELWEVMRSGYKQVVLVVNEDMKPLYTTAFEKIYPAGEKLIIEDADLALIRGQLNILKSTY